MKVVFLGGKVSIYVILFQRFWECLNLFQVQTLFGKAHLFCFNRKCLMQYIVQAGEGCGRSYVA